MNTNTTVRNRFFSLAMAMTMVCSLAIPALAVNGRVTVKYADGSTSVLNGSSYVRLHEASTTDVESVTVTAVDETGAAILDENGDAAASYEYTDFSSTIEEELPGGTTYQLYTVKDANGYDSLYFRYINSLDDYIYVDVQAKAATYMVVASSGMYGENNNLGGTATCTMNRDATSQVEGGEFYSVTFTPVEGQEIKKLNLSLSSAAGTGRLVDPVSGEVSIGTQNLKIFANNNGSVTVTADSVIRDFYAVALTANKTLRYDLNILTDGNCSSSVSNVSLPAGSEKSITFTPTTGYMVTDITVEDGSESKTLTLEENKLRINGKIYTVKRNLDGSAVLDVPAMDANVFVTAMASNDTHFILVNTTRDVRSNMEGLHYVKSGSEFDFVYVPDDDAIEMRSLTVTAPSIGTRTYALDGSWTADGTGNVYYDPATGAWYNGAYWENADDVWIPGSDGRYYNTVTGKWYDGDYYQDLVYSDSRWKIGDASVFLYRDSRDYLHVLVKNVSENMEFTMNSYDSVHTVAVKGDKGVTFDHSSYDVEDGGDLSLKFAPSKSSYTIKTLFITYGGTTYKANVAKDEYVRVNGVRWGVSVDKDGVVTLDLAGISRDVTVRAETNYNALRNMRITKSTDAHSSISYTGTAPFDSEDDVTVRVYTKDKYIIDRVLFKVGTKTASMKPFDETMTLDGVSYKVNWLDNTECSIEFAPLPGSITVTSKSIRGDVVEAPAAKDEKPEKEEPEKPAVTNEPHIAYMKGYGNGLFGPNNSLTRAEAVTVLNRVVLGLDDSATASYAGNHSFADVAGNFWGAGAINYAKTQGYLDILSTGSIFSPDLPITRAEFLALLCTYRGIDVSAAAATSSYSDVPASHWAIKYINYATSKGWVQGVGDGLFTPNASITRAELCTMVNHILNRAADSSRMASMGASFSDVPMVFWGFSDIFEATHSHQASYSNGVESWM